MGIVFVEDDKHEAKDEIFKFLSEIDPENTGRIKYSDFKPRIMEREMTKA